uniref:Neurotransmitter-gated ion-channel ligand-binding domain-containing protein n=1 Tax=Meloidogyne javanica TaxID=6303 RepID=A0A915NDP9_MELJA
MSKTDEKNMMGRWGATSYIVGNIIGSGIFITPTTILNNVHSVGASLLIWILAGIIATLGALCYVELGTSIRKSGGDFAYLCHVRWTAIAFSFMSCACIFTNPGTMAIQMETFSEYVIQGLKLEFCNSSTLRAVVARFQMVAMGAKVIASGIIVICGIVVWLSLGVQSDNFKEPFAHSNFYPGSVALALFSGLFSYDGWDILNYGAEDVKKPRRVMPFAIIVGMSTCAALYITMNLSYFVVLSVPEVQSSNAVAMANFCRKNFGNSLNATLFGGSRYLWASARERHFPSFISCINREHDSPRAALFVHELINYVAFTHWIIRSITMLSLLCIRFNICKRPVHEKAIRVPLILPIIFLIVCLSLVSITIIQSFKSSIVGLLILAIGLAIYILFIWEKAFQRFGVYRHVTCVLTQFIFNGNIELINHKEEEDDFASYDEENYDNIMAEKAQNELNYTNEILNGSMHKAKKAKMRFTLDKAVSIKKEDLGSEAFRDLGGSFITPLLKEKKYDNKSIPLVFADEPLKVFVALEVIHLGNFDNFQMEYELDVFLHMQWYDVRVTLLPDCQMNFCNFPHDKQRCDLLISSIAHPKSVLEFRWASKQPIIFAKRVLLTDLRIQSIGTEQQCQIDEKLIPSSCLLLLFRLKREGARYIAEKYLPSVLAMVLTSYLTSLDIWFVVIKAFTVLSLVESLAVMAYIKRGRAIEKQAQKAANEYEKDLLQSETKRIGRLYHRLDHFSRVFFPVAFICFVIFYAGIIVKRDESQCVGN